MATPNYGWTLPTPGASENVWGTLLNAIFENLDAKSPARVTVGPLESRPGAPESIHDVYIAPDSQQVFAAVDDEGLKWVTVVSGGALLTEYASYLGGNAPGSRVTVRDPVSRILSATISATTDSSGDVNVLLSEFGPEYEGRRWRGLIGQVVFPDPTHMVGVQAQAANPGDPIEFRIYDGGGAAVTNTAVIVNIFTVF